MPRQAIRLVIVLPMLATSPHRMRARAERDSVPISAWFIRNSTVLVARHPSAEDFFDSTSSLSSPLVGTLESLRPLGRESRLRRDNLGRVVGIAQSEDGQYIALAMMHREMVSMHGRQGEVGGISLMEAASGRDLTPDLWGSSNDAVVQPVFTQDGKWLVFVRYVAAPTGRDCPYVTCGENEFTTYDLWLSRMSVATRRETRVLRLGRDDMRANSPGFLVAPHGDRVLVWTDKTIGAVPDQRFAPSSARMIDIATRQPRATFRRNALSMDESILSVDCAPDSQTSRFLEFSPNGRILARGTLRSVKLVDARSGATIAQRTLSDHAERAESSAGDSTQTVIISGHVANDSSLVLTTCRPGVRGSRVELFSATTGTRRLLYTTTDSLRDAVIASGTVYVRTSTSARAAGVQGPPIH